MKLFYISFATETEFLGATVLESHDELSVLVEATKHGLNPGGQAAILEIPYECLNEPDCRKMQERLLTKQQMIEFSIKGSSYKDLNDEDKSLVEIHSIVLEQ